MHTPSTNTPVSIGANQAYTFEGDLVRLEAELLVANPESAADSDWALQLWACDAGFDGGAPVGTKVAELPFAPLADNGSYVSAATAARPPAGQGEHVMVLALASGSDGRFDTIRDFTTFPRLETFVQPRFVGTTGFTFGDDSVSLVADGIENPRASDNLSGTLSLELWALETPYTRGEPVGVQLTAASLGLLGGGNSLVDLAFDLPLAYRPAGTWHIALLLREWTQSGFVTRDFSNFALPVSWAPASAPAKAEVVEAAPAEVAPAKATSAKKTAKPAAAKAEPKAEAAPAAKPAKAVSTGVSINSATAAELAAVKGLPKAVAAAIVAGRPFAQVDDLLRVKGMGAKLLDKLRTELSL